MDLSTNTYKEARDLPLKLFDFQVEAVDKLRDLESRLVADVMGTGKTWIAIGLDMLCRRPGDKTLVVAPLSTLKSTWEHHYKMLTNLKVKVVDPKKRYMFFRGDAVDVYICHWESLRLLMKEPPDDPFILQYKWRHIIADEVHRARNRNTKQTKSLKEIPTDYRTGLTGTPIVNRPDNLWSILNWLYPKNFSSYWRFFHTFIEAERTPAGNRWFWKPTGTKNEELLRTMMEPFYIRRTKREVLKDLPEKYFTKVKVELYPVQRKAYNQMRNLMIAWLINEEVLVAPVVIAQLTRLRQLAVAYHNGTRLSFPSAKIDTLMELIEDNPEESIVVFSQFKQAIRLIEMILKDKDIKYGKITGDVPYRFRAKAIREFQEGKTRIFLGTIGAGSEGITLTKASTVIFLDRDWTPAANEQAEDRLHRIGQKNAVQVIDIVADDTIDKYREEQLILKKEWIQNILLD